MRSRFLAAALIAVAALAPVPSPAFAETATQPVGAAPAVDVAALFDKVVETIDRRFVDPELMKRVDWSAKARAARDLALAAPTTEDAVARINVLLRELNTSHTALYAPDDYQYYILLDIVGGGGESADFIARRFWGTGPFYPGVGAFTTKIGERHFVDNVMEGSPAHEAGLKFGDEIVSVDGRPYSPIAPFRDKMGEKVQLEIRRERDAPTQIIEAAVIPIRPSAAFAAAARASARVIERNGRRVGYIHLWSTNESRSFQAALASIDPTHAEGSPWRRPSPEEQGKALDFLIVDMRGRVGGNVGSAGEVLDLIDRGQKPYWGRLEISGRERGQSRGGGQRMAPFRGRSAMLIDQNTRSAGEVVAHGYKQAGFGPLLGANTAGAVSGGSIFMMPGDLVLYVAGATLEFDGRRLEGVGVAPDVPVERPLPYANGADPVLDAALDRLAGPAAH